MKLKTSFLQELLGILGGLGSSFFFFGFFVFFGVFSNQWAGFSFYSLFFLLSFLCLFFSWKTSTFLPFFAFGFSVCSQVGMLMTWESLSPNNYSPFLGLFSLSFLVLSVRSRFPSFAFLFPLAFFLYALFFLESLQLGHFIPIFLYVIGVFLLEADSKYWEVFSIPRPSQLGFAFGILSTLGFYFFPDSEEVSLQRSLAFPCSFLFYILFLAELWLLRKALAIKLAWILVFIFLVLVFFTKNSPGVIAAFFFFLLAFRTRSLGFLFLSYSTLFLFFFHYYYHLTVSLLHKSYLLFGFGVLFLFVSWFISFESKKEVV